MSYQCNGYITFWLLCCPQCSLLFSAMNHKSSI